jgi:hypothetical protein
MRCAVFSKCHKRRLPGKKYQHHGLNGHATP